MLEEETITEKDLFDTKIMGILTPYPSVVRRQFWDKYNISPKAATDFYYQFSQATNYIRKDRIVKDERWTANTEFGAMDITINLSKPEKDPRDIAGLVRDGRYFYSYMPTGAYAELRNASNRRFVLVEEQTRAKNRLQKWIAVYFPEYKGIYTHIDAKGGLLVLKGTNT